MTLGQICDEGGGFVRTGPFGSQLHQRDYTNDPNDIPVVMPKDMSGGRVSMDSIARIDEATANRLSHHLLEVGDIALSRRGDVGRSAWIGPDDMPVLCGTGSMRIHPGRPHSVLPGFLRYFFRSRFATDYLEGHAIGATMPNLNAAIVTNMPVPVLPLDRQRFAAELLEAIDDLIDNARRRVVRLEQSVQAIYREWFVRFRFPGHECATFAASPLGEIPSDWAVAELQQCASALVDGDWIETKDQSGTDYRLLQVSNIGVGRFRETGNFRHITRATFQRLRCTAINVGDILISRMPEPVGRAWLVDHLDSPAVTAVDVAILSPTSEAMGNYLVQFLNSPQQLAHAEAVATGTTRKRITRSVLAKCLLVLPSFEVLDRYATAVSPLTASVLDLRESVTRLEALRDVLLPRLVTGQLDLSRLNLDVVVGSVA